MLRGPYENETGLVIHFEPSLTIVLSDQSMSELRVAPKDLRVWQDRATSASANITGSVQLMDFVQVDAQTVGVVTRVDREVISVFTCLGKVITVKSNTALRKLRMGGPRRALPQALDKNSNTIQASVPFTFGHLRLRQKVLTLSSCLFLQIKDTVRFLDKPYAGLTGEVKYLYRSWAFVYCRTHLENAGMLVAKARQVALVGTNSGGAAVNQAGASNAPSSMVQALAGSRPTGGGFGGGNRRGPNNNDSKMVGKTARIVAVSCF